MRRWPRLGRSGPCAAAGGFALFEIVDRLNSRAPAPAGADALTRRPCGGAGTMAARRGSRRHPDRHTAPWAPCGAEGSRARFERRCRGNAARVARDPSASRPRQRRGRFGRDGESKAKAAGTTSPHPPRLRASQSLGDTPNASAARRAGASPPHHFPAALGFSHHSDAPDDEKSRGMMSKADVAARLGFSRHRPAAGRRDCPPAARFCPPFAPKSLRKPTFGYVSAPGGLGARFSRRRRAGASASSASPWAFS
jgi:hypothetical protein